MVSRVNNSFELILINIKANWEQQLANSYFTYVCERRVKTAAEVETVKTR